MFFDKQHNLRKGPDGRIHSLDPREEESLQRQYAKASSMTEEEARCLLAVMARGNPRLTSILHVTGPATGAENLKETK